MGATVIKAAQAVGIEEKPEQKKPVLPGEVEKSIALGRSALIRNQKKAAINLARISKDSDRVRNHIVDEGGLGPLIQMTHSKSLEVQTCAVKTLAELAKTSNNRQKMLENGAILPLLEGLKHKSYEVRGAAVAGLGQIGRLEEARFRVIAEGATQGIVKFLLEGDKDNSLEDEIMCLETIYQLSQHPKNHTRMVKDNILPALFDVVHSSLKSNKHKTLAMKTISELCKHEGNHKKIMDFDQQSGIKRIIKLCEYYHDAVRIYAAKSVEFLAVNPFLVQKLTEEGVLDPLKDMIKSDKQNVVAAAVHALCALARDSQNQVLIARKNLIPHLLKKANCGVDEIEQGITLTLALLAQSNINRPKIMFHGGFKPLIYNAQYGSASLLVCESYLNRPLQEDGRSAEAISKRADVSLQAAGSQERRARASSCQQVQRGTEDAP
mmetsp:Transcript_5720/g.20122  ORF Transcript_5720/g.20122 Transcript_5720/m.20122 type:complete len:437 (+) Transcript_5720:53-1363(+)